MEWNDEKADEFVKDVPMKFVGYYKYCFRFIGDKDGFKIQGSLDGDKDDVYKLHVKPEMKGQDMWSLVITDKDGNRVHERWAW